MTENGRGKVVVITGGTRGIGRGLAEAFLDLGCSVVISGRQNPGLDLAVAELAAKFGDERIAGFVCDVTNHDQVQTLWSQSISRFGKIDIWINNAGIGLSVQPLWEEEVTQVDTLLQTNLNGLIYGSRIAIVGMLKQGFGHVYNMEGFGSDGRIRPGMTVYGTSKAAVAYLTRSLARECHGSCVKVSALSPGMVVTDLLLRDLDLDAPQSARTIRIFNILADRVETVTPWLARKVLVNGRNGGGIRWLTTPMVLYRILLGPLLRRQVIHRSKSA